MAATIPAGATLSMSPSRERPKSRGLRLTSRAASVPLMAESGVSFDADGNLVVTTIVPPSEFPVSQLPEQLATAIADANAAKVAADESAAAAEKVVEDLTPGDSSGGTDASPPDSGADSAADSPPAESDTTESTPT